MKQPQKLPWVWLGLLVVSIIVYIWPLFHHGFFITDDGEWMVIRLSAFYQSLAEGQFPVRLLGRLNNSFGYPVANFLYPGYLYVGSLIHLMGPSFVDTIKILFGSSIAASAFFLFLFLRRSFDMTASSIGVISFLGSPYLLYDIYRRGSVGEVLAFVPAFAAMYSIASQSYWLLSLSVAFLIVSHNSLALILGVAIAVIMAGRKDVQKLIRASIIGVGMSTFFWMPAMFERGMTVFDSTIVARSVEYFIGANHILLLGIPTLMAVGHAIWAPRDKDSMTRAVSIIILIGYFLSLPISGFVWRLPVLPTFVQFPYRFLSLIVLFGPWLLAYAYTRLQKTQKILFFCIAGFFYIYGVWSIMSSIVYVDRPQGYYTTNEGSTTVHDEYLPVWVTQKPLSRAAAVFEIISGDAQTYIHRMDTQTIDISINASVPSTLQINKLYYPGWGVAIDGVRVPVDYSDPAGIMKVQVPSGNHRLVANFRETVSRFAADIVSFVFGLLYVGVLWREKKRV